jgi:hypothetical protein
MFATKIDNDFLHGILKTLFSYPFSCVVDPLAIRKALPGKEYSGAAGLPGHHSANSLEALELFASEPEALK